MKYLLVFVLGTIISWVALNVVIPIAQKLGDFSMPPWREMAWKLAVIAAAGNLVTIILDPVNVFLSWVVGVIVFWTFMVKWFQVDFFGGFMIVVVSWVLQIVLMTALGGVMAG